MLDLNYVRDHFQVIIEALEKRNSPTTSFAADFVNFDGQRRKAIAESDRLKAERNAISTRVGVLMKEGKRDEATSLRSEAESLKAKIAKADEIPAAIEAAKASGAAALNVLASPMLHSNHQMIMERVAALRLLPGRGSRAERADRSARADGSVHGGQGGSHGRGEALHRGDGRDPSGAR